MSMPYSWVPQSCGVPGDSMFETPTWRCLQPRGPSSRHSSFTKPSWKVPASYRALICLCRDVPLSQHLPHLCFKSVSFTRQKFFGDRRRQQFPSQYVNSQELSKPIIYITMSMSKQDWSLILYYSPVLLFQEDWIMWKERKTAVKKENRPDRGYEVAWLVRHSPVHNKIWFCPK